MTMASTEALLTALVTEVSALLPELGDCGAHPGRFEVADLGQWAPRAPAVRLACLGASRTEMVATGRTDATMRLTAFVVTKAASDRDADVAALAIVDALVAWLPGFRPTGLLTGAPRAIRSRSLYAGTVEGSGMALRTLKWRQELCLKEAGAAAEAVPAPSELYSLPVVVGRGGEPERLAPEAV